MSSESANASVVPSSDEELAAEADRILRWLNGEGEFTHPRLFPGATTIRRFAEAVRAQATASDGNTAASTEPKATPKSSDSSGSRSKKGLT